MASEELERDGLLRRYADGWYWVDEIEQLNGPYETREDAAIALSEYTPWQKEERKMNLGQTEERDSARHECPATEQIDKLARYITTNIPGEPSKSEGAVDTIIRCFEAEVSRLKGERDEARDWVRRMHRETQVITCVYCGKAYPPGTPTSGAEALTEHIKTCPKHPLAAALAEVSRLKGELKQARAALGEHAAHRITLSAHEWTWTQAEQEDMARSLVRVTEALGATQPEFNPEKILAALAPEAEGEGRAGK